MRSICSALLCLAACGKSDAPKPPPSQPSAAPAIAEAGLAIDAAAVDAPPPPAKAAKVVEVVIDHGRACVRRDDGRVRCWGYRLGETREPSAAVPVEIPGVTTAARLHLSLDSLSIVTTDGRALRTSLRDSTRIETPWELVKGTRGVVSITHSYALFDDGSVREYGSREENGQKRWIAFEPLSYLTNIKALRQGAALNADGTVTWFDAWRKQHEVLDGVAGVVELVDDNIARTRDGSFVRWNDSANDRHDPKPLDDVPAGATHIAFGDRFRCAIVAGVVSCKGRNDLGQLGNGETRLERATYAPVELPARAIAIAADDVSACAILETGALACWGGNTGGQLGDGTLIDRDRPVIVDGATSAQPPPYTNGFDKTASKWTMSWDGLPNGCTRPTDVVDGYGRHLFDAVSAYAYTKPGETHVTLADFELSPEGYNDGRMPVRGAQKAIELGIYHGTDKHPQPLARGRYAPSDNDKAPRRAGISEYRGPSPRWAMSSKLAVDITYVDRTWVCGTYRVEGDDAKPVTRAFAARLVKDPW